MPIAKFRVLAYNQDFMARLGIHSHRLTDPTNEFFKSFATYYNLFIGITFNVIGSTVMVYKYWPDLDIILEPCTIVMGGLQCVGLYLSIGLKMEVIKMLHLQLQKIVDQGKLPN